jgi:hypothetical protein
VDRRFGPEELSIQESGKKEQATHDSSKVQS